MVLDPKQSEKFVSFTTKVLFIYFLLTENTFENSKNTFKYLSFISINQEFGQLNFQFKLFDRFYIRN